MARYYGPQTFIMEVAGEYFSECGRVRIFRLQCGIASSRLWMVSIDGKSLEGGPWPTLREAACAAARARGMV